MDNQEPFRSGFIALIGRPNSGKSTLLNTVLGEQLAVVTPLPQTTRRNLRGILTTSSMQLVFIDTPGIHRGTHVFNKAMIHEAVSAIRDKGVDAIGYVVDLSRASGEEEKDVAEAVVNSKIPVVIIFNKTDLCKDCDAAVADFFEIFPDLRDVPAIRISAVDRLSKDAFIEAVRGSIPEGPQLYGADELTTENLRFFAAEYLRKHVILRTREEVPHAVFIEIESYKETPDRHLVTATIHVESAGQRGIIIGKDGVLIKKVRRGAEADLKKLTGVAVGLTCHVKVTPKWRDNQRFLRDMGYRD